MNRIYLDNAASRLAEARAGLPGGRASVREVGAAVGRGVYSEAVTAQGLVDDGAATTRSIARWAENVAFTSNGTDALNTAIHGTGRGGACRHDAG